MTKLESLKAKIVEAVPEINPYPKANSLIGEWRFVLSSKGKQLEGKPGGIYVPKKCKSRSGRVMGESRNKKYWNIVWDDCSTTSVAPVMKDLIAPSVINCREIALADVLRAIGSDSANDEGMALNDGKFVFWKMKGIYQKTLARWDLSQPLSGQSEETIAFLHDLLHL